MPLPSQTVSALQAAGAAIFNADVELKKTVLELSDRVKLAMLDNPFDVGNDSLFESWKTLARLSQAVVQVEVEFKRIYDAAATLSGGARGVAIAKSKSGAVKKAKPVKGIELVTATQVTDAVIKKAPKKRKNAAAKKKAKRPVGGNTARVLARMQEILNTNEFVKVNRSAVATEIGLPKGSIGASIAKLLQDGQLLADDSGSLKLAPPKAA